MRKKIAEIQSSNGIHLSSDYAYSWAIGPHRAVARCQMSVNDALVFASGVGNYVSITVGNSLVWWGYLTNVETDNFAISVDDVINHVETNFWSKDDAVLIDEKSIAQHGRLYLKMSKDEQPTRDELNVLAAPVIRIGDTNDLINNDQVWVTIRAEGIIDRLRRINLYDVTTGWTQSWLGRTAVHEYGDAANPTNYILLMDGVLPEETNYAEFYPYVRDMDAVSYFEIYDEDDNLIESNTWGPLPDGNHVIPLNFTSPLPANEKFKVYLRYFGAGYVAVEAGDSPYFGPTQTSYGSEPESFRISFQRRVQFGDMISSVNNYLDGFVRVWTTVDFITAKNSVSDNIGDFLLNTVEALYPDYSMALSFTPREILLIETNYSNESRGIGDFKELAPKFLRSVKQPVVNTDETYMGFIISPLYGAVTYRYANGKETLTVA